VLARRAERERLMRARVIAARVAGAASLAILAVALAWRAGERPATTAARLIQRDASPHAAVDDALALDRVAQLQSQSRELDQLLSSLGEPPAVERAGSAIPIESLESQVQWLDHQLSSGFDEIAAQSAERLWRERVDLMHSLVRLRYVEAQTIAM
jgi:hypothetical protein